METVPDPTQIHYRLPKSEAHPQVRGSGLQHPAAADSQYQQGMESFAWQSRCLHTSNLNTRTDQPFVVGTQGLEVRVWRDYEKFLAELTERFPHEAAGIRRFYDECWRVRFLA